MKSYANLEQSKILSKILPHESADMHYSKDFDGSWFVDLAEYTSVKIPKYVGNVEEHLLPCWSLAALLAVLTYPDIKQRYDGNWVCRVENKDTTYLWIDSNPVDACVAMIIKLHELNLL